MENKDSVQVVVRPAILDNDTHWQVFENAKHIAMFIQQFKEFVDQLQPRVSEAYGNQVIQLKTNKLPKGLITLENIFYYEDSRNNKRKFIEDKEDYTKHHVGDGGKLKVGKDVPQHDRNRLIHFYD